MKKQNNKAAVITLIVAIISLGVAFAAFSTTLSINGNAQVEATDFKIVFEGLQSDREIGDPVILGSAKEVTHPVINEAQTDINNYSVSISTPGDSITYNFQVHNKGSFAADIDSIVIHNGVELMTGEKSEAVTKTLQNVDYKFYYTDDNTLVGQNASRDCLEPDEEENVSLKLTFKASNDPSILPTSDLVLNNLGVEVHYVQTDECSAAPEDSEPNLSVLDDVEEWDGECSLSDSELTPENIFAGGLGTEEFPYLVSNGEQLSCLAKSVNSGTSYEGKFISQTKAILLSSNVLIHKEEGSTELIKPWTPIGTKDNPFKGTYDGFNQIVSGVYATGSANVGLFGYISGSTIKNVIVYDSFSSSSDGNGLLVGTMTGTGSISNVKTYGLVNGSYDCGGVVGSVADGVNTTISNAKNYAKVQGSSQGAGIVGYAIGNSNLTIDKCTNNGEITMTSSTAAGIIGYSGINELSIGNSINKGTISSGSNSAGFVANGQTKVIKIENSYNEGTIGLAMDSAGGLVGNTNGNSLAIKNSYNVGNFVNLAGNVATSTGSYIGGIVGTASSTVSIEDCYNISDVSPFGGYVGGIIGRAALGGTITHSYNTGNITGLQNLGGIVGNTGSDTIISECYNEGIVTANKDAFVQQSAYRFGPTLQIGGIAGYLSGTIKNSYNTGDVIGYDASIISGLSNYGTIEKSYNAGEVKSIWTSVFGPGYNISSNGLSGLGGNVSSSYNLGNVSIENNAQTTRIFGCGDATCNNVVNTGIITVKGTSALSSSYQLQAAGIASSYISGSGNFNSGDINIDSAVYSNNANNNMYVGSIFSGASNGSSGTVVGSNSYSNKINIGGSEITNYAYGKKRIDSSIDDSLYGSKVTTTAPSILSVINGDNKFEIKSGDTLPTLKYFN